MKHLKSTLWIAITLILALSSCTSKREKLLEVVPYDADYIAAFNLIELAEKSQISIKDGKLVIPEAYTMLKKEITPQISDGAITLARAIDLENIIMFGYINPERQCGVALVEDADLLTSFLKDNGFEIATESGFQIFSTSSSNRDACLALNSERTRVWLLDRRDYIESVTRYELAVKSTSINGQKGWATALRNDAIANILVDQGVLDNGLSGYRLAADLDVTNNAIVLNATSINADGEEFKSDMLQDINTDFLRYIPQNFIGAFAFGINPHGDWTQRIADAVEKYGGRGNKRELEQVMPYLKAIDGTVAIGFGPKDKAALLNPSTPTAWQAVAMAHMSQTKVNDLTELFKSFLPESESMGNGIYRFNSREFNLYYGMLDGNFALGINLDLKADRSNSFAADFSGHQMAAVLQTPILNTLVNDPSLNYSIKTRIELNGPACRWQINLVGSDSPIIPTLVTDLPAFVEQYTKMVR